MAVTLEAIATPENFDETGYLAANPDVAEAVRSGHFRNGRQHFDGHGRKEGRLVRFPRSIADIQEEKLKRIEPLLRLDLPHVRRGAKCDFLTDDLRVQTGATDTSAISAHGYDPYAVELIEGCRDGLVLDCGAGKRPVYYPNVVNFEIVNYDTTDVLGAGELLPFKDGSFDAVLSLSVLEHVRDPFQCAAEIARVLKPGGKLICCVPFLQPLHGYPHHYYNMTGEGLRALFERRLHIDRHIVPRSTLPLFSLTWFVQSWARVLRGDVREQFLSLRMSDLLRQPEELQDERWVTELSDEANFELASATMLFAHKEA
ncbi:MAG TPA: methyltransferase domain-containing protein [Xanthobacteraceae bacterium]|jgi:SAM-dependent methyltransferase|nr:methyltransferase domain-containing protein [Xanthobacteraceae bacterium]